VPTLETRNLQIGIVHLIILAGRIFCVLSFWVCEIVSSLSTNEIDDKLDDKERSLIASSSFVPLMPSLCVGGKGALANSSGSLKD
jgi:hypothetical protein